MITTLYEFLFLSLLQWFDSPTLAGIGARGVVIALALGLSVLANWVAKRVILVSLQRLVLRTRTKWDDMLVQRRVFTKLSHLAPALVIYLLAGEVLAGHPQWIAWVITASQVYMILVGFMVGNAFLDAVVDIYRTFDISRSFPIKGFVQAIKLIIFLITAIFVVSLLLHKSPGTVIGGLGALTAVLMLVFRDSILGFVAGLHLSANRMVAHGDWVELPSYNADGEVMDVTLATVKVRNWDQTITSVPTYALISESFKNWRGMLEAGGRRIKRPVYIDVSSVGFCDEEMLDRLGRIAYLADYLKQKRVELAHHNRHLDGDDTSLVNGRRLTNIGTFRAYVKSYLEGHPLVRKDMTLLVRQLPVTERGLPIEIYAFCKDTRWANYEAVIADIFDHILAIIPVFGLRVFQAPSGADIRLALASVGGARGLSSAARGGPRETGED